MRRLLWSGLLIAGGMFLPTQQSKADDGVGSGGAAIALQRVNDFLYINFTEPFLRSNANRVLYENITRPLLRNFQAEFVLLRIGPVEVGVFRITPIQ